MKILLSLLRWLNPLNLFWIVDPCGQTLLETESTCFRDLAPNDREAAIVYYLWQGLIAKGFSSDIQDLLASGACFANEPPDMLQAMDVQIAGNAAVAAGSSVSVTLAEAVDGIKCLKDASPQVIRALKSVLRCKLNSYIS